jgi:hypothetical protein
MRAQIGRKAAIDCGRSRGPLIRPAKPFAPPRTNKRAGVVRPSTSRTS